MRGGDDGAALPHEGVLQAEQLAVMTMAVSMAARLVGNLKEMFGGEIRLEDAHRSLLGERGRARRKAPMRRAG